MASVIKATFHWSGNTEDLLRARNLEDGGLVQQFIDNEVLRLSTPYMPFADGALIASGIRHTHPGSGKVIWDMPYARYMYYGEIMGPNIPLFDGDGGDPIGFVSPKGEKKYLTGRPLTYSTEHNALAGSHWFERMKANHMAEIERGAKEVAGAK